MMGQKLVDEGIVADVILASSALRVQQTVERLRETWSADAELITEPALYLASPEDILQATQGLHESWQTAMIVRHNPGMCVAASYLAGEDVDMPTAAVAVFHRQGDSWDASNASLADWRLTAHWKPKEL